MSAGTSRGARGLAALAAVSVAAALGCGNIQRLGPGRYSIANIAAVDVDTTARRLCGEGVRYALDTSRRSSSSSSSGAYAIGNTTYASTTTTTTHWTSAEIDCDLMTGAGATDPDSPTQSGYCYASRAHRMEVTGPRGRVSVSGRFALDGDGVVWRLPDPSPDAPRAEATREPDLPAFSSLSHRGPRYCGTLADHRGAACWSFDPGRPVSGLERVAGPVRAVRGDRVLRADGVLWSAGRAVASDVGDVVELGGRLCTLSLEGSLACATGEQGPSMPVALPAPAPGGRLVRASRLGLVLQGGAFVAAWSIEPSGAVATVVPARLASMRDVEDVASSGRLACALRRGGPVSCWVADGVDPSPVEIPGLAGARALTAGAEAVCALLDDGVASCVGELRRTQPGVTTLATMTRPAQAGAAVVALDADGDFVTLVHEGGALTMLVPTGC